MRTLLLLSAFLLFSTTSYCQIKAITDSGEEVFLYDDGSWKYTHVSEKILNEIKTNPKKFNKSDHATFLVKSKKFNIGFWLDPKKWKFEKAIHNPDAEYELELKGDDLYGMIISEKVEIPLDVLKEVALDNGRATAPDLHIVQQEYRVVNGLKVLLLQMNGSLQGIKFSYYGYYFSNPNGTVQFITYTSQNLLNNYREEIEELLNGLVEL